ncbi:hypothetical protein AB3538_02000 [Acinetobacter baumannii]
MKPGSVILDMAVETGGNVEGSKVGETVVTENGVKILGIPNIPATVATEASALYARNVFNFVETLFDKRKTLRLIKKTKSKKPYWSLMAVKCCLSVVKEISHG